jgi:hypothetical protein
MERMLVERVDAIVAVSNLLAARLQRSKPVYTLNQGVDPVHFSRSQPQ